jgi:hypothetical protein
VSDLQSVARVATNAVVCQRAAVLATCSDRRRAMGSWWLRNRSFLPWRIRWTLTPRIIVWRTETADRLGRARRAEGSLRRQRCEVERAQLEHRRRLIALSPSCRVTPDRAPRGSAAPISRSLQ